MAGRREARGGLRRRLAWFVGLWALSVLAALALAWALHRALGLA